MGAARICEKNMEESKRERERERGVIYMPCLSESDLGVIIFPSN